MTRMLAAGALAFFVVVPPLLPGWVLFLLTIAWAKALVVLGLLLLLRGGLVSFGHGLYYAAGAYTAAFAARVLGIRDGVVHVLLAVVAGAVLAALFGLLLARYRGIFFGLLNMALSMVLYGLVLKFYAVTGGSDGLGVRPAAIAGILPAAANLRLAHYYFTLALGVLCVWGASRFMCSPLGYTLRALRTNEVRVEYMGASVSRAVYFGYVASGILAAVGGMLAGSAIGHVVPEYAYWLQSGEFIFVAILGGTGSVAAPVAGSIVFEFVRNYAFKLSPYTWQLSLGVVLLGIILFLPGGLWSLTEPLLSKEGSWALRSRRSS